MADSKITGLVELTTPETGDIFAIVDSPGVTPVTKKITIDNLDLSLMDNTTSLFPVNSQTFYIGTTEVAINRASATLDLAGIGTLGCGAITSSGAITATSYGDITEANLLDKSDTETITGAWTFSDIELSGNDKISKSTKAARTIYCNNSTGNDTTGDGTSGSPFATIQHTIDSLPEVISEAITIAVGADETYTSSINFTGHINTSTFLTIKAMDSSDNDLYDQGTATGGSSTTLADTSKTWTTDFWAGGKVLILKGTGVSEIRTISSNTSDTLTIASGTTPDATSIYIILKIALTSNGVSRFFTNLDNIRIYGFEFTGATTIVLSPSKSGGFIEYCYFDSTNAGSTIYNMYGASEYIYYYNYFKIKTIGFNNSQDKGSDIRWCCFIADTTGVGTGVKSVNMSLTQLGYNAAQSNTFIDLATGVSASMGSIVTYGSAQTYTNCTTDYTPIGASDPAYIS